jgi:carbamoyltransferase
MKTAIGEKGFPYERIEDDEKLLDQVVDRLTQSKVVSWFRGRFEWGPRALGHRSILADPRRVEMKEVVNTKIKFREPFRPFAPVILEERTQEYFDMPSPEKYYPARYMLLVTNIPEAKRDDIQAVCHVGGTGRLQTIRREWNPAYYRVVEKFGEATGVPVLLNTSYNLRGEPIVTTPQNALNTFAKSDIDALVMGPYLVKKH